MTQNGPKSVTLSLAKILKNPNLGKVGGRVILGLDSDVFVLFWRFVEGGL